MNGLGFFIFLGAIILLLLWYVISSHAKKQAEIKAENKYKYLYYKKEKELISEYTNKEEELKTKEEKLLQDIEAQKEKLEIKEKLLEEKTKGFPWVAEAYARFANNSFKYFEKYFLEKRNPSPKSADIVRELKQRVTESEKTAFMYKGIVDYYKTLEPEKLKQEYDDKIKELDIKNSEIEAQKEQLNIKEKLFEEKTKGFPWVAKAYARFVNNSFKSLEKYFLEKRNPSPKSADIVRELKQRVTESEKISFMYKGIVEYYETLFPWLQDYIDIPDNIILQRDEIQDKEDEAQVYLTTAEWQTLPKSERFQKALDRYWQRHKSNWEIGRDYERYIGYCYELDGWDVDFFGAIKGLEDMGRDLICKKNNDIIIVQCKYWSNEKIIHEKHIFQLFGSCIQYGIEHDKEPKGIFMTSTSLSDMAKKCAQYLNITVFEQRKMETYPSIKCNINKDGEKIYHIPFDQMYDRVKINYKIGECYCATIVDAEKRGFRRAFRWYGNS